MLEKRCNGTGRGVVADLRAVKFDIILCFGIGVGHEERCTGVG